MSDALNTSTSHGDFIATAVADKTLLKFTDWGQKGFLRVAMDVSPFIPEGANKLQVPVQIAISMAAHTQGTAEEYTQWSSSNVSLTINTNKAVVPAITFETSALSNQDLFPIFGEQIGAEASNNVDASLAALYASAGLTVTGTTGANITEANIRSAKQQLDEAHAPASRFLVVNPQQMDALSAISRFSEVQTIGRADAIQEGIVGRVHGFDVYVSTNVVETTDGFAHCVAGVYGQSLTDNSLQVAYAKFRPLVSGALSRTLPGLLLTFDLDNKQGAESVRGTQFYGVASFRTEWLVDIKVAN